MCHLLTPLDTKESQKSECNNAIPPIYLFINVLYVSIHMGVHIICDRPLTIMTCFCGAMNKYDGPVTFLRSQFIHCSMFVRVRPSIALCVGESSTVNLYFGGGRWGGVLCCSSVTFSHVACYTTDLILYYVSFDCTVSHFIVAGQCICRMCVCVCVLSIHNNCSHCRTDSHEPHSCYSCSCNVVRIDKKCLGIVSKALDGRLTLKVHSVQFLSWLASTNYTHFLFF